MNFTKILEYQKKDGELFRLERGLDLNESKKIYQEMLKIIKKAQDNSSTLENKAGNILKDYEVIKGTYEENIVQFEKFVSKNLEDLSDKDIENIINTANSIINNLNILEKRLFLIAEVLNSTLNDFNQTKRTYGNAREKYIENKKKYDNEFIKKSPEIDKIKKELQSLEKDVDLKLLTRYKQLRGDKIYPVFVKLIDRSCGGCRMERSEAEIDKIKNQGYMECENCHRIMIINQE